MQIQRSALDYAPLSESESRTLRGDEHMEKFEEKSDDERAKLDSFLGRGAFGTVYRMKLVGDHSGKLFAVKKVMIDPKQKDNLNKEVGMLEKLKHKNVVSLPHFAMKGMKYFLVMEYADGGTIANLIRVGAQAEATVLKIAKEMAAGLDYIHQQGVAHCDIKPENVLLFKETNGSLQVKLTDFGVSYDKLSFEQKSHTSKKSRGPGTDMYSSPEKKNGRVGFKDDMWGTGCVLFELLKGERLASPLSGSEEAAAGAVAESLDLCPRVGTAIALLLVRDPQNRADAHALRNHLRNGGEVTGGAADPPQFHECGRASKEWASVAKIIKDSAPDNAESMSEYSLEHVETVTDEASQRAMQTRIRKLDARSGPVFEPVWHLREFDRFHNDHVSQSEGDVDWRKWVKRQLDERPAIFESKSGCVRVVVAYHACRSLETARNICKSGFALLTTRDAGFYGKGIYFAGELAYAAGVYGRTMLDPRGLATVLVCEVAVSSAYPVIEHPLTDEAAPGVGSLQGRPSVPRHDAHWACVEVETTGKSRPRMQGSLGFTELVVFEDAAVRVRAIVQVKVPPLQLQVTPATAATVTTAATLSSVATAAMAPPPPLSPVVVTAAAGGGVVSPLLKLRPDKHPKFLVVTHDVVELDEKSFQNLPANNTCTVNAITLIRVGPAGWGNAPFCKGDKRVKETKNLSEVVLSTSGEPESMKMWSYEKASKQYAIGERKDDFHWELKAGNTLSMFIDKERAMELRKKLKVNRIDSFSVCEVQIAPRNSDWSTKGACSRVETITLTPCKFSLVSCLRELDRLPSSFKDAWSAANTAQAANPYIRNEISSRQHVFFASCDKAAKIIMRDNAAGSVHNTDEENFFRIANWAKESQPIDIPRSVLLRFTNTTTNNVHQACNLLQLAIASGALRLLVCNNNFWKSPTRSSLRAAPIIDANVLLEKVEVPSSFGTRFDTGFTVTDQGGAVFSVELRVGSPSAVSGSNAPPCSDLVITGPEVELERAIPIDFNLVAAAADKENIEVFFRGYFNSSQVLGADRRFVRRRLVSMDGGNATPPTTKKRRTCE
eukprot:CAMPEP_0113726342 /NCGR_PEP_ID=MMETSP0038_2-20120614/40371_1 /TAXON_ID=2898 /ORGANISM="Cryptomonas paramecium" /LENGTH=1061 /DNA_ID=CAMNT_0000656923 /DNA_START=58 /DNA_END=3243 /DNA_ORIENTATION=- /assembly_acc=CAM_ASM_000170